MLRVLHTADLHLDTRFTGSGLAREQAVARRNDLVGVFRDIVSLAIRRQVDLLLIAGDLFEDEYVSRSTISRVFSSIAEAAPLPVMISPGNHDPFHAASPYAVEELPPNLTVFRDTEIEKIEFPQLDTAVYGLAFRSHHESRQLLQGFRVEEGVGVNILLSHGAVFVGEPGQAADFGPIDPADLRGSGADYVALGHYHRYREAWSDERGIRAVYPGCPEPLRYGHTDEHGVLLVEIEPHGGAVSVEKVTTQRRRYHNIEIDVSGCEDIAAIDQEIGRILDSQELAGGLVELTVVGTVSPGIRLRPADYADSAAHIFDFRLVDRTIPGYDLGAISSEPTARGAFCGALLQRIEAADEESDEREVLEQALWLGLAAFDGEDVEEFPL